MHQSMAVDRTLRETCVQPSSRLRGIAEESRCQQSGCVRPSIGHAAPKSRQHWTTAARAAATCHRGMPPLSNRIAEWSTFPSTRASGTDMRRPVEQPSIASTQSFTWRRGFIFSEIKRGQESDRCDRFETWSNQHSQGIGAVFVANRLPSATFPLSRATGRGVAGGDVSRPSAPTLSLP